MGSIIFDPNKIHLIQLLPLQYLTADSTWYSETCDLQITLISHAAECSDLMCMKPFLSRFELPTACMSKRRESHLKMKMVSGGCENTLASTVFHVVFGWALRMHEGCCQQAHSPKDTETNRVSMNETKIIKN